MTNFAMYRCIICGGEREIPSALNIDTGTSTTSLYPPCRLCGSSRFERIGLVKVVEKPAEPTEAVASDGGTATGDGGH